MAWTAPVDKTGIVTEAWWNLLLGTSGSMAYLKTAADNPILGSKNGGTLETAASAVNIVEGANITATVARNGGTGRLDITLAAGGSSVPTQSESSVSGSATYASVVSAASQYTNGAWYELIPATSFAITGLVVTVTHSVAKHTNLEIGTGAAASEVAKIKGLYVGSVNGIVSTIPLGHIPFTIASGARVSARCSNQTDAVAVTLGVGVSFLG